MHIKELTFLCQYMSFISISLQYKKRLTETYRKCIVFPNRCAVPTCKAISLNSECIVDLLHDFFWLFRLKLGVEVGLVVRKKQTG